MDQKDQSAERVMDQDRQEAGRVPVRWGDPAWDSVTGPLLDEIQSELDRTLRGGRVFALTVECWKSGRKIRSNKEIAGDWDWTKEAVAEGFRLVRDHLTRRPAHSELVVQVLEYSRELRITRRAGLGPREALLLSVPRNKSALAGDLLAGASTDGARAFLNLPRTGEEESRTLDAPEFAGRMVLPVSEADDYGVFEKLETLGRTVLLDIAVRGSRLPLVSFAYRDAAQECTGSLLSLGCRNVLLFTMDHDSRVHEMKAGYRAALRDAGRTIHSPCSISPMGNSPLTRYVIDRLCWLQEEELWPKSGSDEKVGILCTDEAIGEALLAYLDSVEAHAWPVAVAVIGGRPWPGRHWADVIWGRLNYESLAAEAKRFLLTGATSGAPQQVPVVCTTTPGRKPVGSATAREMRPARVS